MPSFHKIYNEHVNFWPKINLILYLFLGNLATAATINCIACVWLSEILGLKIIAAGPV